MNFYITLSSQAQVSNYTPTTISVEGAVITIDGQDFDLSPIPVGSMIDGADVHEVIFRGGIEHREDGYHLTILFRTPLQAPRRMAYPETVVTTGDGPVDLPQPDQEQEHPPVIEEPKDGPVQDQIDTHPGEHQEGAEDSRGPEVPV